MCGVNPSASQSHMLSGALLQGAMESKPTGEDKDCKVAIRPSSKSSRDPYETALEPWDWEQFTHCNSR